VKFNLAHSGARWDWCSTYLVAVVAWVDGTFLHRPLGPDVSPNPPCLPEVFIVRSMTPATLPPPNCPPRPPGTYPVRNHLTRVSIHGNWAGNRVPLPDLLSLGDSLGRKFTQVVGFRGSHTCLVAILLDPAKSSQLSMAGLFKQQLIYHLVGSRT
jgi:hypothetical protein